MGSYVISVSAGTGCYRHIQISKSATLYRLHKAIINAFDFEDSFAHAFFMDNKYWSDYAAFFSTKMRGDERLTKSYKLERIGLSKGDQFKYVFDFVDEWRFQCKVLRELDVRTDIPGVIRRVGESPEQYPEPEWDEEEWEETEEEEDDLPEILPPDVIQSLCHSLPISMETVKCIHSYFEAAARLYGVIPVIRLLEIYNSQNESVERDVFLVLAEIIRHEQNLFSILGPEDFVPGKEPNPINWDVIDDHLLQDDPEDYPKLVRDQGDKPYKILPKTEFLRYAAPDYYPATPQSMAMRKYLHDRGDLPWPEDTWSGIQTMIEIDFSLADVIACCESEGLTFDKKHDIGEFAALFQELNNHTRKQVNRGHTPAELFAQTYRGQQLAQRLAPENQLSLFDDGNVEVIAPTVTGKPSRNAPCPCGSGRKYKNCCGKQR